MGTLENVGAGLPQNFQSEDFQETTDTMPNSTSTPTLIHTQPQGKEIGENLY